MKRKLIITDQKMCDEIFGLGMADNTLSVYVDDKISLIERLKDKKQFNEDMENDLFFKSMTLSTDEDDFDKRIYQEAKATWEYFKNNFDNILDVIDSVEFDIENVKEFLEEYPILKSKNIILSERVDITDIDKLNSLIEEYSEYSNVYIWLQNDYAPVRLDDCKKIMFAIKGYADYIKSLNLSPLESTLFAYDIVRERVYQVEETDDHSESRDVSKALFGKAIVCAGYAKILACILRELGIKNELAYMDDKFSDDAHLRNLIYADDPKYGIKGCYYLDATWDSKKADSNDYLYSYKFFLKTRDEMEKMEDYSFIYRGTKHYSKNLGEKFEAVYKRHDIVKLADMVTTINRMYRAAFNTTRSLIHNMDLFTFNASDIEKIKRKINESMKRLNKSIDAETYIALVNNVRKVEYYIEPEKYPYSIETLFRICYNSKWEFRNKEYNEFNKDFVNYVHFNTNIDTIPGNVRLAKTLRKILENKSK